MQAALATVGQSFLSALFDALPDAVWVADSTNTIVYVNPAGRTLLDLAEDAPAASVSDRLEPLLDSDGQPLAADERPIERALRGESGLALPLRVPREHGDDDLHLRLTFAPLRDAGGTISGAVVYAGDRTEQYRIERVRDDFLASVAHDLRSPLTAIRGSAQLALRAMRQETLNREPLDRSLHMIDAAAGRLNRMLETLMDSARLERGALALQCVPTDLVALVQEVIEHHQQESRRHLFTLIAPGEPLVGSWDPALLERAVENLVGNAVKYSPNGGEITITCADEGEQIRLSVQDHGVGIPAAGVPHIFNRFYRARNAGFGMIEGNGLGLFAVKGIISSHGGSIAVQSVEGEGTEVHVRLPREAQGCDA